MRPTAPDETAGKKLVWGARQWIKDIAARLKPKEQGHLTGKERLQALRERIARKVAEKGSAGAGGGTEESTEGRTERRTEEGTCTASTVGMIVCRLQQPGAENEGAGIARKAKRRRICHEETEADALSSRVRKRGRERDLGTQEAAKRAATLA